MNTYTLLIHAPFDGGEDQTRTVPADAFPGTLQHLLNLGFTVTVTYNPHDDDH